MVASMSCWRRVSLDALRPRFSPSIKPCSPASARIFAVTLPPGSSSILVMAASKLP